MKKLFLTFIVLSMTVSLFAQKGAVKGVYYVSATGSSRADGLTPQTPKKDLQAVLNLIKERNEDGAVIRVAEGNYLGALDAGYIEICNWVTLEGGYNADFTKSNPRKYITRIEPTEAQRATNARKGLITLSGLDDPIGNKKTGKLTITGFTFNHGLENYYMPADPSDPKNGCPSKAFETGRMVDGPNQLEHPCIQSVQAVAGDVLITNCIFINSPYYAIQINSRRGTIEIANNIFVSNRYGAVRIDGWDKNGTASEVLFHHNVVAFSWCRDKTMEDMGYGFECMTRVNCKVYRNIFACNNYAAIARTHVLSGPDKVIEAKRITNFMDNAFFLNPADLLLPAPGGAGWTKVRASQFEELDEHIVPIASGNFEIEAGSPFIKAIDQDYLKAFASLKIVRNASYDANSAANSLRETFGLNKQGSETTRVSMYGNRYPLNKAILLFGTIQQYGPQL